MGNWKKINGKSKLEGKVVLLKTEGNIARDDNYEPYWSDENQRWEFIDTNGVTCREYHGEPTHYMFVNE